LVLVMMSFGQVTFGGATGPFWALHHELQPVELRAISIAFVNSIGNLGGFFGPYTLSAFQTLLGPACPVSGSPVNATHTTALADALVQHAPSRRGHDSCVTSWAWGMVIVNGGALVVFICVAVCLSAAVRSMLRSRTEE